MAVEPVIQTPVEVVAQLGNGEVEQLAAILHGNGPCIVLAAPGSGKTYVITQRFLRIVRDEGVEPHAILAMAYNKKAATEMLERVETELGPISGDPPLTTYHAWAYDVIRKHGWRLGWPESFRIPPPGEQALHMHGVLERLKPPTLYDPSRPYESIRDVLRLVANAKQELVAPEQYLAYVADRPGSDETGDERLYWERQRDLSRVYEAFSRRYEFLKLVDHDDAIAMAARLLRDFADVRRAYAGVQYVMVDEFQDTNSAQATMVEALVVERRNIMVVADDDQAIYRFRGASRANIQRFRAKFPERVELVLPVNRRSTPELVAFSQAVVLQAQKREPKWIKAQRGSGARVAVVSGRNRRDEAEYVASRVRELHDHGAKWADIAVLTQMREDMTALKLALRAAELPCVLDKGADLFRTQEVKGVMALLEAINDPQLDQAWLSCLRLPAWKVSDRGREAILTARNEREQSIALLLSNGLVETLSPADKAAAELMCSTLNDLQAMALHADVREVFEEGMIRTAFPSLGDLASVIERAQFASNLSRLYEIVDEYCRFQKNAYLRDALAYLAMVRETGEEREASIDLEADAVRISTIHGAKGLEWPHVIVCAAAEGKIPRPESINRFELPPDLTGELGDDTGGHREEQRRLFYVAITRPRDTLSVTWARSYNNNDRESKRTEFLSGLSSDLFQIATAPPATLTFPSRHRVPALSNDGSIRLSFSRIDDFDECPRRFEYRTLWHMSPIFSPEGWYGDILHRSLYRLGQLRLGGETVTLETAEAVWETEWEGAGNRGRMKKLRPEGVRLLRNYLASPLWVGTNTAHVELGFKMPIEHRPNWLLTGKIDRIDIGANGIPTVVDYKSGRPGDEETARKSLQLKIYSRVAMEEFRLDSVDASLHWLQTGESSTVTFTSADMTKLDSRLGIIFRKVARCAENGTYPARPNTWRCRQCAFRLICPEKAES